MNQEINTVYTKLASRVVRDPRSPKWAHLLPRGVFFPDGPAFKRQKQTLQEATVNGGLHIHGVVVATKEGRMKEGLDEHFSANRRLYRTPNLYRIDVEPIRSDAPSVTDYAGKAVKKRRFSDDDILILPKTLDELPNKTVERVDLVEQAMREARSRWNVSEDVAKEMVRKGWRSKIPDLEK
jgi:hypothetical protein